MPKDKKPTLDEDMKLLNSVQNDVWDELGKQRDKWGVQRHIDERWLSILVEEVGEAAQAIQQGSAASKESDADSLYSEVIQVAAVAMSWAAQEKEKEQKRGS